MAQHRLHSQRSRSAKHRLRAGKAGSDKVQQVRDQAKTKLDKVVEDVEDKIDDDDSAGAMEELVGPARYRVLRRGSALLCPYAASTVLDLLVCRFKDEDLQVFKSLIQSMRDTAWGLLALASSVVALALVNLDLWSAKQACCLSATSCRPCVSALLCPAVHAAARSDASSQTCCSHASIRHLCMQHRQDK